MEKTKLKTKLAMLLKIQESKNTVSGWVLGQEGLAGWLLVVQQVPISGFAGVANGPL